MPELVPKGSIPLTEAYARYRSWLWCEHDPRTELDLARRLKPQERVQLHMAGADKVTNLQLSEIVNAFASGEVEALVCKTSSSDVLAIPASSWRDAFFAERMFLSDTIGSGHGSFFDSALGRTPFVRRDLFEAWLRSGESLRERIGSPRALRDVIIGLVMDGIMASQEAESLAKLCSLRGLTSRPKERLFNVNKQPTWSLAMTISWIVWRNPRKVREAWDDYRKECWEWFPFTRRLPIDGGKEWYDVEGEELRPLEPLNVMSLGMLEALNTDPDDQEKLMSVKTAREELWEKLAEGRLDATVSTQAMALLRFPATNGLILNWPEICVDATM
jgi:hypothetical protein